MEKATKQDDIIGQLMDAGCALGYLAERFDDANEYGPSRLIALVSQDIFTVAERMEEEEWEAPSEATLEARRKERLKNVGPSFNTPLKSDEEALDMLKLVFENDEEQAASMKRFIDIAHHHTMKKSGE